MVDVQALARFVKPLNLQRLKSEAALRGMALLRPGQRLSVQPVTAKEWQHILKLEKLEPL